MLYKNGVGVLMVYGKLKFCFWELAVIFLFPNILDLCLVESMTMEPTGTNV